MKLLLSTVISLAVIVPALGEEPRKINFNQVITNQDDKPVMECADDPAPKTDADCKVRQSVTLGMIVMRALVAPEQGLAPDKSFERGQLAMRVYKSEDATLKAEEITLIKAQMAKAYSPLIVVKSFPLLDPAAK